MAAYFNSYSNKIKIIMKKIIIFICIFISGCATFGQLDQGLNYMIGKDVSVAFNTLGYPSSKQTFGQDTVYYWSNNSSGTLFIPQTSTTYGTVGEASVYGTTTYNQAVPINFNCLIKIVAGPDNIMKDWERKGSIGGCKPYIERVNDYYVSNTSTKTNSNTTYRVEKVQKVREEDFLKNVKDICVSASCGNDGSPYAPF